MTRTARGTFDIQMTPSVSELAGAVDPFDFTKTFRGDLDAVGRCTTKWYRVQDAAH